MVRPSKAGAWEHERTAVGSTYCQFEDDLRDQKEEQGA